MLVVDELNKRMEEKGSYIESITHGPETCDQMTVLVASMFESDTKRRLSEGLASSIRFTVRVLVNLRTLDPLTCLILLAYDH